MNKDVKLASFIACKKNKIDEYLKDSVICSVKIESFTTADGVKYLFKRAFIKIKNNKDYLFAFKDIVQKDYSVIFYSTLDKSYFERLMLFNDENFIKIGKKPEIISMYLKGFKTKKEDELKEYLTKYGYHLR